MRKMLVFTMLVAGCAQLPPSPEDTQAKRFETVPGKAAVYVVRTPMDSREMSGLALGDSHQISTQPGTYYRWDVGPGTLHVGGTGAGLETVTLTAAPGKIYFLEHTVLGDPHDGGVQLTRLREISDQAGRRLVMRSELLR